MMKMIYTSTLFYDQHNIVNVLPSGQELLQRLPLPVDHRVMFPKNRLVRVGRTIAFWSAIGGFLWVTGNSPTKDVSGLMDGLGAMSEIIVACLFFAGGLLLTAAGRVAEIGSVKVTDQFFVERYSQVMHIVSNVEGKLRGDCDPLDALTAGFPAGTVSGAPKVRAMQIIDELEKEKRGLYAGCVGYFSAGADMDTCIALRTALIKDGTMYVQAGAGIVADSDPEFEQQECINKAKALFRAAEEAKRFANAASREK